MRLSNAHQIREADRIQIEELGYPGITLMENAARAATEKLLACYPDQQHFLILAGPGNNGGDGLAMARMLYLSGKTVRVSLSHSPDRYQGDAAQNYHWLTHFPVPISVWQTDQLREIDSWFTTPPILVDALLGTGIEAKLRAPILGMIQDFRSLNLLTVAIDLPSGLNANTGDLLNEVLQARHTFTFQLPKICHFVTPAAICCGEVHVLEIGLWPTVIARLGIAREVIEEALVTQRLRKPSSDSHKGTKGHLLLMGGSAHMPGAIALSTKAAVQSGVGLMTVACPLGARQTVLNHVPEAMCLVLPASPSVLSASDEETILSTLSGKQALAIGPGMGQEAETVHLLETLLDSPHLPPMIWDADALNLLAAHPDWWDRLPPNTILTPHPGEMRRLLPEKNCLTHRLEAAEQLARERKVVVVLKGQYTVIASPDGTTYVNPTGNVGMATGGMGDVLTGMIGALLAQGYLPIEAALLGVWFHGKAGDDAQIQYGTAGLTPSRLLGYLQITA